LGSEIGIAGRYFHPTDKPPQQAALNLKDTPEFNLGRTIKIGASDP
jgi:hypothetical protein